MVFRAPTLPTKLNLKFTDIKSKSRSFHNYSFTLLLYNTSNWALPHHGANKIYNSISRDLSIDFGPWREIPGHTNNLLKFVHRKNPNDKANHEKRENNLRLFHINARKFRRERIKSLRRAEKYARQKKAEAATCACIPPISIRIEKYSSLLRVCGLLNWLRGFFY